MAHAGQMPLFLGPPRSATREALMELRTSQPSRCHVHVVLCLSIRNERIILTQGLCVLYHESVHILCCKIAAKKRQKLAPVICAVLHPPIMGETMQSACRQSCPECAACPSVKKSSSPPTRNPVDAVIEPDTRAVSRRSSLHNCRADGSSAGRDRPAIALAVAALIAPGCGYRKIEDSRKDNQ